MFDVTLFQLSTSYNLRSEAQIEGQALLVNVCEFDVICVYSCGIIYA